MTQPDKLFSLEELDQMVLGLFTGPENYRRQNLAKQLADTMRENERLKKFIEDLEYARDSCCPT